MRLNSCFVRWVAAALWLLAVAAPISLVAREHYLPPGKPDGISLLAAPPSPGSPEQEADLDETISVHKHRGPKAGELGKVEGEFTVFTFAPVVGTFFEPGRLPKTDAFFKRIAADTKKVNDTAKNHWRRPRPYTIEPKLSKGSTEKSFSYPGGHSTKATVFALVLADIIPDKSEGILAEGRAIGWHRVVMGKHYPTDTYAGRVLAQAIVRELNASAEFQRDLAQVRDELAGVRAAGQK